MQQSRSNGLAAGLRWPHSKCNVWATGCAGAPREVAEEGGANYHQRRAGLVSALCFRCSQWLTRVLSLSAAYTPARREAKHRAWPLKVNMPLSRSSSWCSWSGTCSRHSAALMACWGLRSSASTTLHPLKILNTALRRPSSRPLWGGTSQHPAHTHLSPWSCSGVASSSPA